MDTAYTGARCVRRLVVALFAACFAGCMTKPPDLKLVTAVDIRLDELAKRQKAAEISSKDAAKIEALIAALQSAEATSDHKCGDSGQLVFHRKGDDEVKLGILAGHDPRYYEFRVYQGDSKGIFRMERARFQKAMAGFGVEELDPGRPE